MSYNRTLTHALQDLGLNPKRHLPPEGMPEPKTIQLVDSRGEPWIFTEVWILPKGRGQRVKAACPYCNKSFSLGNLAQHIKAHKA